MSALLADAAAAVEVCDQRVRERRPRRRLHDVRALDHFRTIHARIACAVVLPVSSPGRTERLLVLASQLLYLRRRFDVRPPIR